MAQGLVATIFEAGPNDDLLAVDVYEGGGGPVVNSYQKKAGGAIDVLSTINGGDSGGGGSSPPAPAPAPAPAPSKTDVNKILSDGNSDIFGFLTNLSNSAAAKFGIDTTSVNTFTAVVNGITKALNTDYSASDVKAIAGIANVLSDGGYVNTVKDKKALDALVMSTVATGSEIGLPNVFSKIASNPKHDKSVLATAAKQAVETTVAKGDTSVFLDVVSTEYVTGLKTRYPAVINDVLTSTMLPDTLSEQGYGEFYKTITNGLSKVDGEWNKDYRNNEQILISDAVVRNPFLNETLESFVLSIPLDIKYNSDPEYNSVVDVQFGDVQLGAIFRAIYGATLDNDFIALKVSEWLSTDAMILRQERTDAWMTLVSKQFDYRTIEDDFKFHFPLEIPDLNRSVTV